jgi:outer membrane protein OmpA-like peptidoglycan-associated protein
MCFKNPKRQYKPARALCTLHNKVIRLINGLWLSLIILSGAVPLAAQQCNTCGKALEVHSSSGVIVSCNGATEQQFRRYFTQPQNIAWLTFVVLADTQLTFDLVPSNSADNLDFLLFKDADGSFCRELNSAKAQPLRFNLSTPQRGKGSSTGLSIGALHDSELHGDTPPFCKSVKVKRGERYYLLVNDAGGPGSFNFYLHLNYPGQAVPESISSIDARPIKVPPMARSHKYILRLMVTDSLGNPLKAMVDINAIIPKQDFSRTLSEDSIAIDYSRKTTIYCNSPGYMLSATSYTAPDTGYGGNLTIRLSPIIKNKDITLGGIMFEPRKADLLPESEQPLLNLVTFMHVNPKIKIIIKGYVNDPYGSDKGRARTLSEKRAKAVYNFVKYRGVARNRMKYKGCGSESLIYPHPENMSQEQANRRVEIIIE